MNREQRLSEVTRRITFFLCPPLEYFFDRGLRRWYEILNRGEVTRTFETELPARYEECKRFDGAPAVLRALSDRLREEHQRLDILENKARGVLFSASLLISLGSFVLSGYNANMPSLMEKTLAVVAIVAILYLSAAVVFALWAGGVGIRFYIDPKDITGAQAHLKLPDARPETLHAAIALCFKDLMSSSTERKRQAVQVAMGSLQRGLFLGILIALARVVHYLFHNPGMP